MMVMRFHEGKGNHAAKIWQDLSDKTRDLFCGGEVVTHNPQLILDNVNYIRQKEFCNPYQIWPGDCQKRNSDGENEWRKLTGLSG